MSPRKSRRLASRTAGLTMEVMASEPHYKRRQPLSANSLHAPRRSSAHTLEVAQQDGFGAPVAASNAQPPLPPARAQDAEPSQDTTAAAARSQRPAWNAGRRYYSTTSSFPDYARPSKSAMGPDRLRQMNQSWAPANTLTKNGNKRELPASSPVSYPVLTKRQRLDPRPTDSRSPESAHRIAPTRIPIFNSRKAPESKADGLVDIHDTDPPPANITSDIVPRAHGTKRRTADAYTPALSKRPVIRHKAPLELDEIETSEDELQANHSTIKSKTRQTNFSQIQASPLSRRRMRGDITPTKFRGSAPEMPSMAILKAVSGKYMYDSTDSNHPQLSLRVSPSDPSLLEASSNGRPNEECHWVSFNVKDVRSMRYGGCYLYLRRSMIRGRPPTIILQFASAECAAQAAKMIDERTTQSHTREEMKQMLDVAWEQAVASSRHANKENASQERVQTARERNERHDENQQELKSVQDKATPRSGRLTEQRRSASPVRRTGMETRRTRRTSPTRKEIPPDPIRWSEKNNSWEQDWKQTLIYPATGRNRAAVDKEDIPRLDEGQFLNDNLISFYLRYLQTKMEQERPELFNRVHIFSTFFFEKLTSRKGGINYDGVKSWTSKLDLFSYDYIVVPVNENAHWYMAVICNTPKLLEHTEDDALPVDTSTATVSLPRAESPIMTTVRREMSDISLEDISAPRRSSRQLSSNPASSPAKPAPAASSPATAAPGPRAASKRLDASEPRIVTLDSLGSPHSATCRALKDYLVAEAKDKKSIDLAAVPGGMKARGIPEQDNFCDCGVFLLAYMEAFLQDPDALVRRILLREDVDWSIDPAGLRSSIRELVFALQREQTERLARQREAKQQQRRMARAAAANNAPAESESRDPDATSADVTPPPPQKQPPAQEETPPDDGVVDIVKMPPDAPSGSSAQQVSTKRASSKGARKRPESPPPSSCTADGTPAHDTQESVQLLSVAARPQTPRASQAKSHRG